MQVSAFECLLQDLMYHNILLTELLQKKPEDLAMNQADNYRTIQENRYLIDKAIPGVDYGKGCKYNLFLNPFSHNVKL